MIFYLHYYSILSEKDTKVNGTYFVCMITPNS